MAFTHRKLGRTVKADIERKEWEERTRKWEREAEEARQAKALKDSMDALSGLIDAWAEKKRINGFFEEIEHAITGLPPDEQWMITQRLAKARMMIGEVDVIRDIVDWKSPEER